MTAVNEPNPQAVSFLLVKSKRFPKGLLLFMRLCLWYILEDSMMDAKNTIIYYNNLVSLRLVLVPAVMVSTP